MISYFEFNGRRSTEFGIRIYNNLEFTPAKKRIEEIEVLGRDGVLLVDDKSYKPVTKTINFDIKIDDNPAHTGDGSLLFKKVLEISKWLNVDGFKDFKYSMYPGFVFKATILDDYNIKDTLRKFGRGTIQVRFHPFMYYENGLSEVKLTSGMNLKNEGIESAPLIRIIPKSKKIVLQNNGVRWLTLENAEMETFIDSELMQAYNIVGNANGNIASNRPIYPILNAGNNKITVSEGTADIFITPRYREVVI